MKTAVKNNLSDKYSKGTIIIHWVSFMLIILLIPTGFIMGNMEAGIAKLNLLRVHMFVGILVFALTLVRVWFFFRHKRPSRLETGNSLHNKLVIWIENSFYYILILLCITGIATIAMGNLGEALQRADASLLPRNLDIPPLNAHKALSILLIALLIGHIGGVVNHYLKNKKENTLKRILP
ncbi:cytochrome b/b6 domain-containing protein [Flavobacterium sp. JP2137]|uniref:cytochrome b/b6 domain-containing protein n=1 Tax=Flavobacterium sp. JP2137 TaxID=3414510 RepID=UPI003D2FC7FC